MAEHREVLRTPLAEAWPLPAEDARLGWIRQKLRNGIRITDGDVEWLLTQYDALRARFETLAGEGERTEEIR